MFLFLTVYFKEVTLQLFGMVEINFMLGLNLLQLVYIKILYVDFFLTKSGHKIWTCTTSCGCPNHQLIHDLFVLRAGTHQQIKGTLGMANENNSLPI